MKVNQEKRCGRNKLLNVLFSIVYITGSIPLLVDYQSARVSSAQ